MIDIDFIKQFLSFDEALPFFNRETDIIPIDLTDFLRETNSVSRFRTLIRPMPQGAAFKVKFEKRCQNCNKIFVSESSMGSLDDSIKSDHQFAKLTGRNVIETPILCPECTEAFVEEYKKEEQERIKREEEFLREREARIEEKKKALQKEIDSYFDPSDDLVDSEAYLRLQKIFREMSDNMRQDFVRRVKNAATDKSIFGTRYWSVITRELMRMKGTKACSLTGKDTNLVALPRDDFFYGLEMKNEALENYFVIQKSLLDNYSVEDIRNGFNATGSPDPDGNKKFRLYRLDEKLRFGKYEGEYVSTILQNDPSYLRYMHSVQPEFGVIDENGHYII